MSGYILWELDIQELIRDFSESELSASSAEAFLKGLGLGELDVTSDLMSARQMLLVYRSTDYAFTSDDLNWISMASRVVTGRIKDDINVYLIEMLCDEDDYYTCCAAIVKLINVVCAERSVFFFKVGEAFAIGAARSLNADQDNNFCVSALIHETDVPEFADFLYELAYVGLDSFSSLIIRHSPQEGMNIPSSYDRKHKPDPDYLRFLYEVEASYGESTQNERNRYWDENDYPDTRAETYKDACKRLSRTAEGDDSTSLDELEKAEAAEIKAAQYVTDTSSKQIEDSENSLSEEAYKNAEIMLRELLGRDVN